ncbi:hypothetical protein PMAYCL1PPCAC_01794 [Pristionchus mayeri]|uniref:Rab-GAP TBC domain-containing protein n=1 Tax=Pristionchus mayeri TaxID=1317129 RepID=A0AAN4Z1L1_9BILA|nr:hypothetical protein PMAYCL1PPCAC_01794 [Pristionchus mayeri]
MKVLLTNFVFTEFFKIQPKKVDDTNERKMEVDDRFDFESVDENWDGGTEDPLDTIGPSSFKRGTKWRDDDESGPPSIAGEKNISSPFRRGLRSSSSLTRVSAIIRRSLRLPSRTSFPSFDPEPMDNLVDEEGGPRFTEWTDLRLLTYPAYPGRLEEIRENRRLGRTVKVKQIVRKANWPARHEVRKELWRELCKDKSYDASITVFNDEMSAQILNEARTRSPSFLSHEGAVVNNFSLTEDGTVRLIRMLAMIEQLRPDISCAPIMYPLCALFMHYMDDQDAYACAQYLSRRGQERDPPVHLLMSQTQWDAAPHVLLQLIKKHKPNAYALLKKKCGTSDDEVLVEAMVEWKQWLFQYLPLSHIVRIVDCFLVEGHKFLLRAAIANVYMWSKVNKSKAGPAEGRTEAERIAAVKHELSQCAAQCQVSTETFIEMAVLIKNLKSATIARLQTTFEKKVRESTNRDKGRKQSSNVYCFTAPFESSILGSSIATKIMSRFPSRLQLMTPELLFKLSQDGASFTHLWSKVDEADQTLLIIRSARGEVFGAYCSSSWAERNDRRERTKSKYFGTGESFVFKITGRDDCQKVEIFGWVGNNNNEPGDHVPQMFMTAGDRLIVIGSGDGDAIRISEELTQGISSRCSTFNSPPLVDDRGFDINEMEVFGVTSGT